MQLRQRYHNYELPIIKYEFYKRNLIIRSFLLCDVSLLVYHCICYYHRIIVDVCFCFVNVSDRL